MVRPFSRADQRWLTDLTTGRSLCMSKLLESFVGVYIRQDQRQAGCPPVRSFARSIESTTHALVDMVPKAVLICPSGLPWLRQRVRPRRPQHPGGQADGLRSTRCHYPVKMFFLTSPRHRIKIGDWLTDDERWYAKRIVSRSRTTDVRYVDWQPAVVLRGAQVHWQHHAVRDCRSVMYKSHASLLWWACPAVTRD